MNKQLFRWKEKENTLYVSLLQIMPNEEKLGKEEWLRQMEGYHTKTFEERLEMSDLKEIVLTEIAKHPGCRVCQYIDRR